MKQASRTRTFLQISNTANNETPDAELMRKELGAFICHAIDDLQPRLGEPFLLHSLHSNAQLLGRAIRKHWGIENQAHWTLDCTFAEDACRIRSFHSPRNFALLRRIALNALNREHLLNCGK